MSSTTTVTLAQAPVDTSLVITDAPLSPGVAHRLMIMGWRPGGRVRVVNKAAGGVQVIDLNGSRVAVGKSLARQLLVEAPA